jgi:ribosomal protein S3AE
MAIEKKKFLPVQIPLLNREIELLAHSNEDLDKRFVKIDLTPELKGKNIELRMKVILKEGKPTAEPVEVYLMGSYIRRIMRKGTDYVEDSFALKCKDQNIIVKPFLITRKKVSRKVKAALRDATRNGFAEYAKSKSFDEIILDMVSNRIQREISIKLKKIYPLGVCEIRFLGIITEKNYAEKAEKAEQVVKKEVKDQEEEIIEKHEKKQKKSKVKVEEKEEKVESKEMETEEKEETEE